MPRVRILNENFDTPNRQFPVGTAVKLTCQGEVGSDASRTIRWCSQKTNDNIFTGLPQTPIHSEASPSGCQYTRSSTIIYNLTNEDTFTRFLCESGDTGMCGTGTAVQYVNITLETASAINTSTADDVTHPSSLVPVLSGSAVGICVIFLAIILTIILRRHFRQQQMKKSVYEEYNSRDTTSYDNAEHYIEPGPTVDHLYTELNTVSADQQRRQGQFVATTDHPYSELNMTNTMNREGEEGQACPTGDHHYTELNTKNMVPTINIPRRTQ